MQLQKIAKPDPQDIVVYNLVDWAARKGRFKELISNCQEANPRLPELTQIAAQIADIDEQLVEGGDDVAIEAREYGEPPVPPNTRRKVQD